MKARTGQEIVGWTAVAVMMMLLVAQLVQTVRRDGETRQLEREIAQKRHAVDSLRTVLENRLRDTTGWAP